MKYEEFVKSDYYESISSLSTIAIHLSFFFGITIIVILPIFITIIYGIVGFGIGILVNFILLPYTITIIRNASTLNLGVLINAVLQIIKTKGFLITTLTIVNIFILLKFGLQTLVSSLFLISIYCIAIVLVYLVTKSKEDKFRIYFRSFCITPLIINLFVLINFVFSFNPVKETYAFQNDLQASRRGYQESTYIFLENNKYDKYPGIRTFLDYEEMRDKKHITYTFKEGILGLRVMTGYEFNP